MHLKCVLDYSETWKLENKVQRFFTAFKASELHEKCILILDALTVTAHKLVYS